MELRYDYDSLRAKKARFRHMLDHAWLGLVAKLVIGLSIVLLIVGVVLDWPATWLVLNVVWPLLVLGLWYKYDLKSLSPASSPKLLDDVLDAEVLALLPPSLTPVTLARVLMLTSGGLFYVIRFGIGPNLLTQLLSDDAADMDKIWQEALAIKQQTAGETLTSAMLTAALLRTTKGIEPILAHLQLDKDDIISGVDWQEHVDELIRKHSQHRLTGGFGRDWSFGYTPLLERFGVNISRQVEAQGLLVREIEGHQAALSQIGDLLSSGGHRNAALVGPLGVGKTTLVYAFADRLLTGKDVPDSLRYNQVISLDAATLISRAPGRGELETLVSNLLSEAYSARNIILCLDGAELFFEEGVGSVDLSNVLLPVLDGGALRMLITMDQQRFLQIGQRNPALARSLNQVPLKEPEKHDVLHILQDQLILFEFSYNVTYMYQALQEAYRLGARYMYDLAMPGKAMKLLESAAKFADNRLVTAVSVQKAIEQTSGVKIQTASDESEREKLLNLEQLIHERMINQTHAVSVVSDALRRARAGVRNLDRPIGTFLFLGPTGVGKTELAKSIAAVYFGGEDKMVRLDLNEYVQASDVSRLIASGATDPNSLTAQIAKQPFSVVLLDEIEKATPEVLNTLLQLLDEGILRDENNREISFKDAIIVATSNAGAEQIRAHIEKGEELEQFEENIVSELINSQEFRPEFLNRFDEIVLFRPLKPEELLQVVDLILAGINNNLALQKVTVTLDEDAKKLLVEKGNDPRLGARPMRRMVQRTVENLVAKRMLGGQVIPGDVITITLADVIPLVDKPGTD